MTYPLVRKDPSGHYDLLIPPETTVPEWFRTRYGEDRTLRLKQHPSNQKPFLISPEGQFIWLQHGQVLGEQYGFGHTVMVGCADAFLPYEENAWEYMSDRIIIYRVPRRPTACVWDRGVATWEARPASADRIEQYCAEIARSLDETEQHNTRFRMIGVDLPEGWRVVALHIWRTARGDTLMREWRVPEIIMPEITMPRMHLGGMTREEFERFAHRERISHAGEFLLLSSVPEKMLDGTQRLAWIYDL